MVDRILLTKVITLEKLLTRLLNYMDKEEYESKASKKSIAIVAQENRNYVEHYYSKEAKEDSKGYG